MAWYHRLWSKLPKKKVELQEVEKAAAARAERQKPLIPETVRKEPTQLNTEEDITDTEHVEYPVLEREILPEKVVCPDCGGITLEGLEYCDRCGGELTGAVKSIKNS